MMSMMAMMRKLTLGALVLVAGSTMLAAAPASAADCFNCAKDSGDKCAGADQCRGSRDDCRKAGCKITGTASCSTAANVKICLSMFPPVNVDADGQPIMTPADPALHASLPACD